MSTRVPRKNVLIFVADQLRADHLGCYGNHRIDTSAIDALAARGAKFTNFHASNPICMPSRSSLLTGRPPSLHGVRRNGIPLALSEQTFVQSLGDHGYRTALIGKAHFQPYGMGATTPVDAKQLARRDAAWPHGYRSEDIELWKSHGRQIHGNYYGFEDVDLALYHGDGVQGDYAQWLHLRRAPAKSLIGRDNALPSGDRACRDGWRTRVPEELYSTSYIAERSCEWLQAYAQADDEHPFFMMCSFPDPHHPFTPPGRYWDMYDPKDMELPTSFRHASDHPLIRYIHEQSHSGSTPLHNHHPFAPGEQEARNILALTFGMISMIDRAVGRICAELQALGLDDDTVIAFTSDHGDLMGDHGAFLKGPMHMQGLTRVPMIWVDPGESRTPHVIEHVHTSVDLAPTVLEATHVPPYLGIQGSSWVSRLRDHAPPSEQEGAVLETESATLLFGRSTPFKLRSLVTPRWRITHSNDEGLCELYDHEQDPDETCNLWRDPGSYGIRANLTERLLAHMTAMSDTSPAPLASG